MKKLWFRLLLSLFGIGLSLLFLEIGLRVAPPSGSRFQPTIVPTQHTAAARQPDFRDRNDNLKKGEGVVRVVVVGDSFTWGVGIQPQDAYPDRMHVAVSKDTSVERYEVVNFSRPGWNTPGEVHALERNLEELQPDLLLLGYSLNDAEESGGRRHRRLRRQLEKYEPQMSGLRWLYRASRAYRLLHSKWQGRRSRRLLVSYYRSLYNQGKGWRDTIRAMRRLRELATAHEIDLQMVIFPIFDSQLDHRYSYRELHHLAQNTAEEIGIPVFDLLPVFEPYDARRLAVIPFTDAHPNELAHRIAADAILQHLARQKLIDIPVWLKQQRQAQAQVEKAGGDQSTP